MSSKQIASKLPDVGTTIFTVMSKMAADYKAINLSQGFPDFEVAPSLQGLVGKYMREGFNQYAPMAGLPKLLENIGNKIKITSDINVDPYHEITVTAGATEGLFATISAMVNTGDEVIILEPAYDSYVPAVRLNGGIPVFVPLQIPDFSIDWELLQKSITPKTKLIIINTPHNPTGTVLKREDLQQLESLVEKYNLWIISDEVYEHLIYDDHTHQSILMYPGLRSRGAAVYSFGKTFHATGWKVGYVVAPEWLTAEIRKIHQYLTFSVNTPIQHALATYLEDENNYKSLGIFFQQKRDHFLQSISSSKLKPVCCEGTYFQVLSYKGLTHKSDVEMATWLTQKKGIASIPLSVFYHDNTDHQLLRFCFAKNEKTLSEGAKILCKI